MTQVIIVGGGLSGLSAAHTVLENGGRTVLLERNPFCGGNSTKATSGINGAPTRTQADKGIPDSVKVFEKDIVKSANLGDENAPSYDLAQVLASESGPAVDWLIKAFDLDLSLVSRLGGHSEPRTHRGKERFPGMTITYALMEKYEAICKSNPEKARLLTKSKVIRLLTKDNKVVGVEYEHKGQKLQEYGAVILATGGYGADFSDSSLLKKYRPDLLHLPTTNGDHCVGDGIKMSQDIGAGVVDMEWVQVHPTGLVNPKDPNNKIKFLAAEALRGVGGILLDANGERFADELGRRDYVTGRMWKNKGPFRLILNSKASKEIEWHCKHYVGRGLMKHFATGADLAKEIGCTTQKLDETFKAYNKVAQEKKCPYGKKFFHNVPFDVNDNFHVSIVTPVVHYTMGGLRIDKDARVLNDAKAPVGALYATGELCGGIHGKNRLGGNSLLDCVVYGRVSGRTATKEQLNDLLTGIQSGNLQIAGASQTTTSGGQQLATSGGSGNGATAGDKEYTAEEVAKHNKEDDCWVILNDLVLDVTAFMADHPGGKDAIMLFAGQDASEQFDMLHQPSVLKKFAPELTIGKVKGAGNKTKGTKFPSKL